MPQARASDVPGIHSQPPERAVVPPKRGSFSTIEHLEAVMTRGDGGGHAGGAGADHQRVAFVSLV